MLFSTHPRCVTGTMFSLRSFHKECFLPTNLFVRPSATFFAVGSHAICLNSPFLWLCRRALTSIKSPFSGGLLCFATRLKRVHESTKASISMVFLRRQMCCRKPMQGFFTNQNSTSMNTQIIRHAF